MRSGGCYRLEGWKGVGSSLSKSIWCFPVVSYFFYPALLDSSSSLLSLSLSFLPTFRLSPLSRNNLISVVVRSFYSGMFSDPFRLVWQLMQPIFKLISFYLVSFINQYVNSFRLMPFPGKDRKLTSLLLCKLCSV